MGAQGTAIINFGARETQASVTVTGQTSIASGSLVEGWLAVEAVGNTTTDDCILEPIQIRAGAVVAGTGFTLYATCLSGFAHGQYKINWVWN